MDDNRTAMLANSLKSARECLGELYDFLLDQYAEPDQSKGETVELEACGAFNSLCVEMANLDYVLARLGEEK